MDEFDDYFSMKFAPFTVVYIMGRSYKEEPKCDPKETLYDCWKDPNPLVACGSLGDLQQMCVAVVLRFSSNPVQQMFGFAVAPGVHDS